MRVSEHRDHDDLLTAGLGAAGLRSPLPPALSPADDPDPAQLRRRAIWSNWRGIADLAPGGGFAEFYGSLDPVPGREYHALRTLPGARHPHRVMTQVPDAFDAEARCLIVTASSGSRGIYGAIALAGGYGLPRGCAVAYTDKGAGTDWFDADSGTGVRLDGRRAASGTLAFAPKIENAVPNAVFGKHAHSGDNPEADWGRHVRQAAEFGLEALNQALPAQAPFTFANTRIIALGVSNGGGAVLRASADPESWLDAVVAVSPNIHAPGSRPLFDYASEAALLLPCALAAPELADAPFAGFGGAAANAVEVHCQTLRAAGLVGDDAQVLDRLRTQGWELPALRSAVMSTAFDLWNAIGGTYAAAYARTGTGPMPCALAIAQIHSDGRARSATAGERAAWWSDSAGIPPGAGLALVYADGSPIESVALAQCLRDLWEGKGAHAEALQEGVRATRAAPPRSGLPVLVIHGRDDGLVPIAFSTAPWVSAARAAGADVRLWRVEHAQHFDAFLGFPALADRYVPLLPYAWRALDRILAHLRYGAPLPVDADIHPRLRAHGKAGIEPLTAEHLDLP